MKTTIVSNVKFKISFPQQIFLHHNTAMEVSSLVKGCTLLGLSLVGSTSGTPTHSVINLMPSINVTICVTVFYVMGTEAINLRD